MKQNIRIFFLLFVVILIAYLTLQTPEQTGTLSTWAQRAVLRFLPNGNAPTWITNLKQFRCAAHIPEYFLLGLALCAAFADRKHGLLLTLTLGFLISLCDESLKILLPTREFSARDLVFDAIGISLAAALSGISLIWSKKRYGNSSMSNQNADSDV